MYTTILLMDLNMCVRVLERVCACVRVARARVFVCVCVCETIF